MKKKIITVRVTEIDVEEFEGSLSTINIRIQRMFDEYGPTAHIHFENYQYPYDQNQYSRYYVTIDREENDAEFAERTAREEQVAEQRISRERAEYERLRKQFENE